jgi:hypothetical protein
MPRRRFQACLSHRMRPSGFSVPIEVRPDIRGKLVCARPGRSLSRNPVSAILRIGFAAILILSSHFVDGVFDCRNPPFHKDRSACAYCGLGFSSGMIPRFDRAEKRYRSSLHRRPRLLHPLVLQPLDGRGTLVPACSKFTFTFHRSAQIQS